MFLYNGAYYVFVIHGINFLISMFVQRLIIHKQYLCCINNLLTRNAFRW